MIPITTLLLIPILPSTFCGAISVGHRVGGWLALSWILTLGIFMAITFKQAPPEVSLYEEAIVVTGKRIGAALAMSVYWLATGVLAFFVVRRIRMGWNAGGEG